MCLTHSLGNARWADGSDGLFCGCYQGSTNSGGEGKEGHLSTEAVGQECPDLLHTSPRSEHPQPITPYDHLLVFPSLPFHSLPQCSTILSQKTKFFFPPMNPIIPNLYKQVLHLRPRFGQLGKCPSNRNVLRYLPILALCYQDKASGVGGKGEGEWEGKGRGKGKREGKDPSRN